MAFTAFLIFYFLAETTAQINSHKCMEISTFGYTYEAVHKLSAKKASDNSSQITFYVKTQSDAHILMSNTPRVIQDFGKSQYMVGAFYPVAELVLGGGRNTFSDFRLGGIEKRTSVASIKTPGIVSADEFRGFYINLEENGNYVVGRVGNATPILTASPGVLGLKANEVTYFGVSTWNHVKGKWKFNCENQTDVEKTEDIIYKGVEKLKRDMLSFYDPNYAPQLENGATVTVTIDLHVHHLKVNEQSGSIYMTGKAMLKWMDPRLVWEEVDYNSTSFRVPATDIWTPILLLDQLDDSAALEFNTKSSSLHVSNNGNITWMPSFSISHICDFEIQDWPKDMYECVYGLRSGEYENEPTQLEMKENEDWEHGTIESDWNIKSFHKLPLKTENNKSILLIYFQFTRKSLSYMKIFTAPFLASAMVMLGSMWLRHDNNAKLYLRCMTMIILTIFFIAIGEAMPVMSSTIPTILSFYIIGINLACLAIVHFAIVKNVELINSTIPHWGQLILDNSLFQTFFCLPPIEELTTCEKAETKLWIITGIVLERFLFLVYLTIYIILFVKLELF